MSVAAMTLDDQRLNNYGKMPKQYVGVESPDSPQYHHHHHPIQQQPQHQQQQRQDSQQHQQQLSAEQRMLEDEIESLKAEQERLVQQCADTQRREKILTRRLANKEQEFQDYVAQIAEYKAGQVPSALALRSALLDPAVNLLFEKLKKELKATKAKLEETQNELSAWKFTPDSNTGKRLMAKCRLLYQENEELGKMTSSGRLAKLETDLAMQKSFSEEVKKSQSELDDFLQELDEDVEGMQSTILFLQQELKMTRERIQDLEKENLQLKNGIMEGYNNTNNATITTEVMMLPNTNNEEIVNENIHVDIHAGHNGKNAGITKGNIEVETDTQRCYQQNNQQNEMNNQTINEKSVELIGLAPIKEEPCVRVSAYTCGNIVKTSDYYNGIAAENQHQIPITNINIDDDVASGSKQVRSTSVITRKRAYDISGYNEIITESTIIPSIPAMPLQVTHIAPTPRTLPPKKSKLRLTTTSLAIASQQEISSEMNENEIVTSVGGISDISSTISTTIPTSMNADHVMIRDSTINDEAQMAMPMPVPVPVPVSVEECPNNSGVAQRILTRRRSMRSQQNGV